MRPILTPEEYAEDFDEAYCAQLEQCETDLTCDNTDEPEPVTRCEFVVWAATACLDGAWGCDPYGSPTFPAQCAEVYDC